MLSQALESEELSERKQTSQAIRESADNGKISIRFLLAYKEDIEEEMQYLEEQKKAA